MAWEPREKPMSDCEVLVARCRTCAAQGAPRPVQELRSLRFHAPFSHVQIDLVLIKPVAADGSMVAFALICVATRCVYFQPLPDKRAETVARALLECSFGAGIVFLVVPHDQGCQFMNGIMKDFLRYLGSRQVCSMAYHPQQQGIIERCHRGLRRVLVGVLQGVARIQPDAWQRLLPFGEAKLRHHPMTTSGVMPCACVKGYFCTSALQSAVAAVEAIPADFPMEVWTRSVVAGAQQAFANVRGTLAALAAAREDAHAEHVYPRLFLEGDLVRVEMGMRDPAAGKLQSRCVGPFRVSRVIGDRGVVFEDPVSRVLHFRGGKSCLPAWSGWTTRARRWTLRLRTARERRR